MYEDMAKLMKEGNAEGLVAEVKAMIGKGAEPHDIIDRGLLPPLQEIGEKFKNNEIFMPEVLVAAWAMLAALAEIKPLLVHEKAKSAGKVIIGTVFGDLHDIGKNLVAMMLEAEGFEVKDLGMDVQPEKFIEEARDYKPDIIALSALLSTTMPHIEKTINAFEEAGLREHYKFLVGGAPVTQDYADKINADGYASDAVSAVEKAREIIS